MTAGIRTTHDDFLDALGYAGAENYESALPLLARVVAFDATNEDAYELWVACHVRLGRLERAIELADAGLTRGLRVAELNVQKSLALQLLGRYEDAACAARNALTVDPLLSDAILALASAAMGRNAHDEAIEVYRSAIDRNPDDADVHFALLELANRLARHELAIETARDYLRRFEKDAVVLAILGQAYVATGDYRRAERAFRDAAHLEPDAIDHHVNVLMALLIARNESAFEAYLERLAERDEELAAMVAHQAQSVLARLREERDGR